MQFYGKVVRCDNPDCALPVFRQIAGRTLTDTEMTDLLAKGKTGVLSGLRISTPCSSFRRRKEQEKGQT